MYGKLIGEELIIAPPELELDDGTIIYNFNKSISKMKEYGFKPIIDTKPFYNVETQYCELVNYQETTTRIKYVWEVKDIEIPRSELAEQDTAKALEMLGVSFNDLTDEQALRVQNVFPIWQADVQYIVGQKVVYNDILFKVITQHKSQADWTPPTTPSLFARVLVGQGEILDWVQPDSTNPYMIGDKVKYDGKVYVSKIDNNVWSPADYPAGWEEVTG